MTLFRLGLVVLPLAVAVGCSIIGAPATRVRKIVQDLRPPPSFSFLRSSSGSTAEPRFLITAMPTSRSRSSALSRLTWNGSTSVIA